MKVYRLEVDGTGIGPLTSCIEKLPIAWVDSHYPPMDHCSPVHAEYMSWIKKLVPDAEIPSLPFCYKFAFKTLKQLKKCFRGFEKYDNLILLELEIDTEDYTSYVELSDGQVIFNASDSVINKVILN